FHQKSTMNTPVQYVYEAVDPKVDLILKSGKEYILELFIDSTSFMYGGLYGNPPSRKLGEHLVYYDSRRCSNCDTNTFPPVGTPSQYFFGVPDFLYSLVPLKRGMNDAAIIYVDSNETFCPGNKDIY